MKLNLFNAAMMAAFLRPKWRVIETVTLAEAAASVTKTYTAPYKGFRVIANTAAGAGEITVAFTIKNGDDTVVTESISSLINTAARFGLFQGWLDGEIWRVQRTSAMPAAGTETLKERVNPTVVTISDHASCNSIVMSVSGVIPADSVFVIEGYR